MMAGPAAGGEAAEEKTEFDVFSRTLAHPKSTSSKKSAASQVLA